MTPSAARTWRDAWSGVCPATPATPPGFATRDLGNTGTCTGEPRGALVIIRGMPTHDVLPAIPGHVPITCEPVD